MNFNSREKALISLLAVIAVGAIYFNLFLMPQLKYIDNTKKEIEQFKQTNKANELVKKAVGVMDADLKILKQRFKDLRAIFPPKINQEELLLVLRDIADECEVYIESVTFSEIAEVKQNEADKASGQKPEGGKSQTQQSNTLNIEALKDIQITNNKLLDTMKSLGIDSDGKAVDGKEIKKVKAVPDGKAYSMDTKIFAKGSNDQVKSFLSKLEGLKNKSIVKDMSINKEQTGILNVNLTIEFFGIMDRKAGEYSMLADGTWKPLETGERDNIFETYEGYKEPMVPTGTSSTEEKKAAQNGVLEALKELQKYDITMGLLPFGDGMSPPTVTITGRNIIPEGGILGTPVIYGDNREVEKVNFIFEELDGKTVCRIKTGNDSYPRNASEPAAEIKTAGDSIMILIDSLPRKGANDKAGADITITNKSKKKVLVDVRYEDEKTPRVKINKTTDNIEVNYKK